VIEVVSEEEKVDSSEALAMQPRRPTMGNQQLIIISQLLQIVDTIHHIDDLLLWLSQMFIRRMDIQVIQFWAPQEHIIGPRSIQLRTMAYQNKSLPHNVVANSYVSEVVEQILKNQQGIMPRSISNIFSPQQVDLLVRNDLNYWGCYFLSNSALMPSAKNDVVTQRVMTPLKMAVPLFFQQKPQPRAITTLSYILEQSVSIAKSRGLLVPSTDPATTGHLPTFSAGDQSLQPLPPLAEMIPSHIRETAAHPNFNPTVAIPDKLARRLYLAVDGRKNLAELAAIIHLSMADIKPALRILVSQNLVQLFGPDQQAIASARFLRTFS
jgi:hypothetical protein